MENDKNLMLLALIEKVRIGHQKELDGEADFVIRIIQALVSQHFNIGKSRGEWTEKIKTDLSYSELFKLWMNAK